VDEDTCRNCWQRVVLVNYSTVPMWVHQPAGASNMDGVHRYCHMKVAEPERKGREPHSDEAKEA
jgi:hypothetical protein